MQSYRLSMIMYRIKQFLYLLSAKAFRFLPFLVAKRYQKKHTKLLGKPFILADAASFVAMYIDIFVHQGYRFHTNNDTPLIVDCGANIGLSLIYFNHLFPKARIIAFEPDETLFELIKHNTKHFAEQLTLYPYAVWREDTMLSFTVEGADGGRVETEKSLPTQTTQVQAVDLKKYLTQPVDLLKIDIEGAELTVLESISDKLHMVSYLFVEYHSFRHEPQQLSKLLSILEGAGFRYYIRSEGVWNKTPFTRIQCAAKMDIQLGIWAYRE